jgi:hypothetical protein
MQSQRRGKRKNKDNAKAQRAQSFAEEEKHESEDPPLPNLTKNESWALLRSLRGCESKAKSRSFNPRQFVWGARIRDNAPGGTVFTSWRDLARRGRSMLRPYKEEDARMLGCRAGCDALKNRFFSGVGWACPRKARTFLYASCLIC